MPHSGGSLWKGFLITAVVLSIWIQVASTQSTKMMVEPNPPHGLVGGNITLSILGLSKEPRRFTWFRRRPDESNRIATYNVQTRQQTPANGRETVFPNGSLFITNLTLKDNDKYIIEIFFNGLGNYQLSLLSVYLQVYDLNSKGGYVAGMVIGVLIGVALIGALIYFLFIRKFRGASRGMLWDLGPGRRTHLIEKHSQVMENNIYSIPDSTPSAQGLGSIPTSSAATPEGLYQALDATRVDIYDSFDDIKKPQTKECGRSPQR